MTEIGAVTTNTDPWIDHIAKTKENVLIAVYVNDNLVASNSSKLTERNRRHLSTHFNVMNLREVSSCLGIEITLNEGKIVM